MGSRGTRSGRILLAVAIIATALAACGRKGPLEPPLSPAEIAARQQAAEKARAEGRPVPEYGDADEDSDGAGLFAPPRPRPAHERTRGYTVPKEPFVLDPLL